MKKLNVVSGSKKAKPAKGAMSKGKPPKGKLKHMHVRPMDNGGYTVESDHEMPPKPMAGKGNMAMPMDYDAGTHRAGFDNPDDALTHIGSLMGAGGGAPGGAPDDEGGAPPAE